MNPRMRALLLAALAAAALAGCVPRAADPELARWEARAREVTITRDDWGIAHVRARTDAGAVFGMIFAQAEDDFRRIEDNYLDALGRRAEAEGEGAIWRDLRMKLFVRPDSLQAQYAASPPWLRELMDAWADGLNYWLRLHPGTKPRVIARFEPWMALSFTEGSIGGDIESISLAGLERFYGGSPESALAVAPGATRGPAVAATTGAAPEEPRGSNGIAIAPGRTRDGHALLLVNPHTSLFFRSELQVTSDEGLNAYGAVTWGQCFVYQGFNERLGWMHTSSGVDAIDEWAETVVRRPDGLFYRHGAALRPLVAEPVTVPFRTDTGMASRTFTVYRTHHGPIVRAADGRWVSVGLMHEPVKALSQSFLRTKARNHREYRELMELKANSSNNTVFASADGDIAYFHGNFVPRRDPRFDWRKPVDGADPRTDWRGLHAVDECPNLLNPASGWLYNANNWPYSAAGASSPKREAYPAYMERGGETPRGLHALRLLEGGEGWTLESLRAAAFDPWLPGFATLVPSLLAAFDALPAGDPQRVRLAEAVESLRGWDCRWAEHSVPTTLAAFWGDQLWRDWTAAAQAADLAVYDYLVARVPPGARLAALAAATDTLAARFGTWKTPWGEVNRFQRPASDRGNSFDDAAASLPVPFASGRWGSLASFGGRLEPRTKRLYGTAGNSFVAVIEFGPRVRAVAVMAGGASGDPKSRHFTDQAPRYASGRLREVYFYPEQLRGHAERTYRPGR